MNHQSTGIAAALVRAWRAIARAFTPSRDRRAAQADGAETTLFGPLPERSRTTQDDEWDANGESTDFADPDPDRQQRRR